MLTDRIKQFLYIWNGIVLVLGIGLLMVALYMEYIKKSIILPQLAYTGSLISGGSFLVVSILGVHGLHQHKLRLVRGERNHALTVYVVVSGIASVFIVLAGIVAISMSGVFEKAAVTKIGNDGIKNLEMFAIEKISEFSKQYPKKWVAAQDKGFCCGFEDPNFVDNYLPEKYKRNVTEINNIAGYYCTRDAKQCGNGPNPCPRKGSKWCRQEFFATAKTNSRSLGLTAIILGASEVLAFFLSLYILLCDANLVTESLPVTSKLPKLSKI